MTGLLHENEFSRKSFVKAGGALVAALSVAGVVRGETASAAGVDPFASNTGDATQVDSWVTINADNTASITTGYPEVGSGAVTGLLMIAAEELDMDLSQVSYARPDTSNTQVTSQGAGSSSGIRAAGIQQRASLAYARLALLGLASTQLGVPTAQLSVSKGVVSGGGKSVTYGELLGGKFFNVKVPNVSAPSVVLEHHPTALPTLDVGQAPAKPVSQYTIVGTSVPRIDIPAMVTGSMTYIQNVRIPGMLHGRVVMPRGQGVAGSIPTVVSIDPTSINHIPGVQIVHRGNFVGVVAPAEYDAIQAAAQLKIAWATAPTPLSGSGNQFSNMRELDSAGQSNQNYIINRGTVDNALRSASKVVSATYTYPYQGHYPIGPFCVIADVTTSGARILTYSQTPGGDLADLPTVLGLPANRVRSTWFAGSSYYGNPGPPIDAATLAAAVMSQAVSKPVRLQLMRWDDHGWDHYGTTVMTDARGGIDANGNIVAIDHSVFASQNATVDMSKAQLGTGTFSFSNVSQLQLRPGGAVPGMGDQYNLPNRRILVKNVPPINGLLEGSLRAPNVPQTSFAAEQLIDELAHAANMDPVAFRRQNVTLTDTQYTQNDNARYLAALNTVTQAANWQAKVAASNLSNENVVAGRGIAFAAATEPDSHAAVIADVQVNKKTGRILVTHLYAALDSGLAVNPELITNSMSGGLVQATSRALWEEVVFNKQRVTSLDWVSYPILRFKDHPNVTTIIINRPDYPPRGAGEAVSTQPAAAIANAFFDATGVRIRAVPMTPARVRATLKAAGAA